MGDRMKVREAGYREQVCLKAYLGARGHLAHWPGALDTWEYDASSDRLVAPSGYTVPVEHEASALLEVLRGLGLDDSGVCVAGALSDADTEYLDRLDAAYEASPTDSKERALLWRAYDAACARLGQEMGEYRAERAAVRALPREPRAYILRLAEACLDVLSSDVSAWLFEEPWADVDVPLAEYLGAQVFHAVAEAYARIGSWSDSAMAEVLTAEVLARFVEDSVSLSSLNERVLLERVEAALALVSDAGRSAGE